MKGLHRFEPLLWLLFGGGGFAAALILPALFCVVAILFPLGWFGDPLTTFLRMRTIFANPMGQLLLIGVLSLVYWHSAHHLRHFALDLGLHRLRGPVSVALYGLAGISTLWTVSVVLSLNG